MIKNQKEKYCYLTPDFPKEAFIIVATLSSITKLPLMFTPLSYVIKNMEEADKCIEDFIIGINKLANEDKIKVLEYTMIIPITLEKLFPLKKDYWTKGKIDPKYDDKFFAFLPAISNRSFYKILVEPCEYVKKTNHWELHVAYPFSVFDDDKEVEKYIYGSDNVVDTRAKYVALYLFGEAKRYNWKTGEISDVEKNKPKKPKIVN